MNLTEIEKLIKSKDDDNRIKGWASLRQAQLAAKSQKENDEIFKTGLPYLQAVSLIQDYDDNKQVRSAAMCYLHDVTSLKANIYWKRTFDLLMEAIMQSKGTWYAIPTFLGESKYHPWFFTRDQGEDYPYVYSKLKDLIPSFLNQVVDALPVLIKKLDADDVEITVSLRIYETLEFYADTLSAFRSTTEEEWQEISDVEVRIKEKTGINAYSQYIVGKAYAKHIPFYLNWIKENLKLVNMDIDVRVQTQYPDRYMLGQLEQFLQLIEISEAYNAFIDFKFTDVELIRIFKDVALHTPSALETNQIFEKILSHYKQSTNKELKTVANKLFSKLYVSVEEKSKNLLQQLNLPKTLPQEPAAAMKFIAALKIPNFGFSNKDADKLVGMPAEIKSMGKLAVKIAKSDSRYYNLLTKDAKKEKKYWAGLHKEMQEESEAADQKKMKADMFSFASVAKVYVPKKWNVESAIVIGTDNSGNGFFCELGLKSIYDKIPVLKIEHDSSDPWCSMVANSLPEYVCRLALKEWGERNFSEETVAFYLGKLKVGIKK